MKPTLKPKLRAVLFGTAAAAMAVAVIFLHGIYVRGWDGGAVLSVARIFALPAAAVNGRVIPLADYRRNVSVFYSASRTDSGISLITPGVPREAIEDNVLERMIRSEILRQVARNSGIVLSDADLDAEMMRIRKNPADAATIARILPALGWSRRQLEENILRPYLLDLRLGEVLGRPEAGQRLDQAYKAAVIWRFVR